MTFLQLKYENVFSFTLLKVRFADSLVSELSVACLIFSACRVLVFFNYYFYLLAI